MNPHPLRVLVVDDESVARRRLARLLAGEPQVELVGEAADAEGALQRVLELRPDLVLLDVRMPGRDGLELARMLPESVQVVFTTAHADHAVAAFETAAADYLLKPVSIERLRQALERVRERRARLDPESIRRVLRESLAGSSASETSAATGRIGARRGDVVELFDPASIPRFRAESGYVVFSHEGREHVVDESLNALEQRLAPLGFLRIHRAELVRLADVRALHRQDEGTLVELRDGQRAPVSRALLPELKRRLGIA